MKTVHDGISYQSAGKAQDQSVSIPIDRRRVLAVCLGLGSAIAMCSLHGRLASAATAGGADGARRFVSDLAQNAIAVMANPSLSDAQRVARFRDLFVVSFDLLAIGQFVLGRHWRAATPDEQLQFLKLFERQQVLIWAGRFKYFQGQTMIVDAADVDSNGGWQVASHVNTANGQPFPVDWSVAQSSGNWRVDDVTIAGASLAFTLREDFGAVLKAHGGDFGALLTTMQSKIDQMNAG
jgi:phospholipid transport system substrate-binding protein